MCSVRGMLSRTLPLFLALSVIAAAPAARAQSGDDAAIERRIDGMLQRLTLEQKIDLLGGEDGMFTHAEPAIGLPRLKMSDGPLGVRTWGPSTAYAGGVALAASWDPELARRVGMSIGRDARARGVNFVLGPGVNIYRLPVNGRNFEYFGEDPYLAGRIAVGYIQGVQSQGVVATVKHYDANNSEQDRHNIDAYIDERTLREIYLPAFEAAVTEGHVGAAMNSYNLVNGEHATQNAMLNLQILKGDWGFRGLLMSDWAATYDGVAAANAGLDLEMPSAEHMNRATLIPAVRSGRVPLSVIDDKVRRLLRVALENHFLDRPQMEDSIPRYNRAADGVALSSAQESIALLKNDGGLLPLDRRRVHSIAVLGPDAWPAVPGGGGSSIVTAFQPVSLLTALSDGLGAAGRVTYIRGIKDFEEAASDTGWSEDAEGRRPGLREEMFAGPDFSGPAQEEHLKHLDHFSGDTWGRDQPVKHARRITGYYQPAVSGRYFVIAQALGHDAYRVILDGAQVLNQPSREGQSPQSAEVQLTAGKPVRVEFDYWAAGEGVAADLGIVSESDMIDPEAARLAAAADVAVVSVGYDPRYESEGFDRTFALPAGQDLLVQRVEAANPRTIVVLTGGGAADVRAWIDRTPVLLHGFYGGQEGGRAMAQVLLGIVNPSGHLPFSFERRLEDNPTFAHYYAPDGSTRVDYAEGVFLGYRYYDQSAVKPLFAFGHGLSYTTFRFSHLTVAAGPVVAFDVTNTGARAGATVAQLYVGDPSARVERPVKELKRFQRVFLAPGQTRHLRFRLDRRALAYWSVATHGWQVDPGRFTVYVGDASDDVPLQADFQQP